MGYDLRTALGPIAGTGSVANQAHREAVALALRLSVTVSELVLRTMNQFAFPEVHCAAVEQWNFSRIVAGEKIAQKIQNTRGR